MCIGLVSFSQTNFNVFNVRKLDSIPIPEFMGVKIEGSRTEIISKLKAKGFNPAQTSSQNKNATILKGFVGNKECEVYVSFTPKTNLAWKLTCYLPKQTDWYSLKNEYNHYLTLLTEKYGEPNSKFDFFSRPYYEGDGYEMLAVSLDKCNYSAFWNNNLYLQITKFEQVAISYENPINGDLKDKEKSQIESNVF